jgi:ribosome biogenesis GTPase
MSKRRISDQQSRRIHARRSQSASGTDALLNDDGTLGAEQAGIVISRFSRHVDVEGEDGVVQRCHLRTHLEQLVCGDHVRWRASTPSNSQSHGVVVAALPRKTLLARPDDRGRLKPIAANVDRMFIVIAPQPEPFPQLIDRYMVAAENDKLEAILVLNKTDLLTAYNEESIDALLARYEKIGYRTLRTCQTDADSLVHLQNELNHHASVFVGQSGVGKSSLINVLLPGVNIRVGELSEAEAKGKHTTTTSRLYHFPAGGDLIDSPGIRDFSLSHLNAEKIADGFREFHALLGQCQFRDCRHSEEPNCAYKMAAAEEKIDPVRWESYLAIRQSPSE